MKTKIKIAVVDDHSLFRSGLVKLIQSLGTKYKVILEAENGRDFLDKLDEEDLPDMALVDISMPIMDGFKTVTELQKIHPLIKILIVTMNDDEFSLIRMMKLGVRGYINKDIEPHELKNALSEMETKGFYYTDQLTDHLINAIKYPITKSKNKGPLSKKELYFIQLACSEDTYDKIADTMRLSSKTIDGYRSSVFEKLNVRSRVGLVMYAMKNGLVDVKDK